MKPTPQLRLSALNISVPNILSYLLLAAEEPLQSACDHWIVYHIYIYTFFQKGGLAEGGREVKKTEDGG